MTIATRPRLRLLAALWLLAASPARADDPPASDAAKAELAKHQGTWQATSFVYDGKPSDPALVASIKRIVEGDHVVWKRDGKSFAGTKIVLDPAADPPAIDVIPDGGRSRDKAVLGLYKLEADRLTLCMAAVDRPRPDAFTAEKGSGRTLMTFERVAAPAGK